MTIEMKKIYFAPMQGYTDLPYRNFHSEIYGGIEEYYTPFIRIERGDLRHRDVRDVAPESDRTGSLVPQIIVRDTDEFEFLVIRLAEMGHRRIDVNMGCPFPMQSKKGRGAGLLQYPERVAEILSAMSRREDMAFSIKMRLGNESASECMALLPMLNDTQLVHITMHPRVGTQQYKGEPDMESFEAFMAGCRHRIVYNGDVRTADDIDRIERLYPDLHGVMVGRGLLMRPSLAMEYRSGKPLSADERMELIWRLHDDLSEYYSQMLQNDGHLLVKMQTFWEYLEWEIDRKIYKSIKKAVSMAKYNAAIAKI